MNKYTFTINYDGKSHEHVVLATDYNDACEKAARLIIDIYDDALADESCDALDKATLNDWESVTDIVYEQDGLDISVIEEIND